MKIRHIKFSLTLFGIGYWKDVYKVIGESGKLVGYTHNILLPFCRIQFGCIYTDPL